MVGRGDGEEFGEGECRDDDDDDGGGDQTQVQLGAASCVEGVAPMRENLVSA